jgi:hypothetical protein
VRPRAVYAVKIRAARGATSSTSTYTGATVTEQPKTEPEDKRAEVLMDRAAGDLRSHMNTALVNLSHHRELLASLVGAGLVTLPAPAERTHPGGPRDAVAPRRSPRTRQGRCAPQYLVAVCDSSTTSRNRVISVIKQRGPG